MEAPFLPATTLGLTLTGSIARFTRSAMLEVLRQSYMRTAKAKGAPRWRQVVWHALPNAAIPTVTVIGFQLGWLIGGSVVIETVFAWPGAGRLFITAVGVRDFAVVQLFILMVASTVIIANLFVDILYGILDPRISVVGVKNEKTSLENARRRRCCAAGIHSADPAWLAWSKAE